MVKDRVGIIGKQCIFFSFNAGLLKGNRLFDFPYFLRKFVRKGDVCIDIGANLGHYSVPLSKLVGENGKIYSVEPVKPVLSVLRKNTKSCKNIEILPFALGKENKVIQLGNDTVKNKGFIASGSNFILDKDESANVEFDAEMKKGSEVFEKLKKLDFVKCDIEGYEVVVIPELEPILVKFKPVVLIESKGESRKILLEFFKKINFKPFVIEGEILSPTNEKDHWDMMLIPDEKIESFKDYIKQ